MQVLLSAVLGLALWFPLTFNFTLPKWFTNQFNTTTIASPQPTPAVFLTFSTSPEPTTIPSLTPKPTATPSPKPSVKPSTNLTVNRLSSKTAKPTVSSTFNSFSAQQVLSALNQYRSSKGVSSLQLDDKLQSYSQSRANYLKSRGSLDNHSGFNSFIQNEGGFSKLGFNNLAENQSWNYKGTASGLISEFYAKSPGHNANQLNKEYTHVGIGIAGMYTNIVFGGSKQ